MWFPDAADRMDYTAESHHHSPGMTIRTAPAMPMADPKGAKAQEVPESRRSSTASTQRFNRPSELDETRKIESMNPLGQCGSRKLCLSLDLDWHWAYPNGGMHPYLHLRNRTFRPLCSHVSTPYQAQDLGIIHPCRPNEILKNPIHARVSRSTISMSEISMGGKP